MATLQERRYDFQLQKLRSHVLAVMYELRSERVPRSIRWIEKVAKRERMKVSVELRPDFDRALENELRAYIKEKPEL